MGRARHVIFTLFLWLGVALIGGCGYYNPYMLPDDEQGPPMLLYIPVWANQTNVAGYGTVILNALGDWLIQNKRIIITRTREEADYVLEGKIVSISFPGLSYGKYDRATGLKAVLTVQYALKEEETGRVIRQQNGYVLEEPFALGSSTSQTEDNKKKALQTLADDLAENLYIRIYRELSKDQRRSGGK